MKKITFLPALALLLTLLALPVYGQVNPQAELKIDTTVRKGVLDNGLTYYIKHNTKPEKRAEFYICTNVGAIEENERQNGLAHFLEHMAFNGIKSLPGKEMFTYLESIGAKFGENINAMTGVEFTSYMLNNIPVEREGVIDTCLMILHDWSCAIENKDEEINNERPVIIEELRQGMNASRRMMEEANKYIYKDSKYATTNIIGTIEELETFDPNDLRDFYATWYRPDLQAIIVVGDIDPDEIENKIKTRFSDIRMPENPQPKIKHAIPGNEEPIVGIITDPEAANSMVQIIYKTEPMPDEYNKYELSLIQDLITYYITSVLDERFNDLSMQPNPPFLGAVSSYYPLAYTCDAFTAFAINNDGELAPAFEALMTELEKAKRYGFTEDEFSRAKTNLLKSYENAADRADSRQNAEFVQEYIGNFLHGEPYMEPADMLDAVKRWADVITLEEVNASIPELLTQDNIVVIVRAPEKEGITNPAESEILEILASVENAEIEAPAQTAVAEKLMDEKSVKPGKIKKEKEGEFGSTIWTLSNGMEVIYKYSDLNKGRISMNLILDGGKSLIDDDKLLGADETIFTYYTMMSGVADFSATELDKILTGKTISVNPNISSSRSVINCGGSNKDIETIFQLMWLRIMQPRFDQAAFQTTMAQLKALMANMESQPTFVLSKELTSLLYDTPRKYVLTAEMIDKVKLEDIEESYAKAFSNFKGGRLYIIGDASKDEIKNMVAKYVASLPAEKKPVKYMDRNEELRRGEKIMDFRTPMEMPKTTVVSVYAPEMPYTAENMILGDALAYALDMTYTKTIREEEGGSYGVGVQSMLANIPSERMVLMINFDTQDEKADKLIELVETGITGIAENGLSDDYMTKIKENFNKVYSENSIRNTYWMNTLINYYEEGINTHDGYLDIVNGLTSDKIREFTKNVVSQGNYLELVMRPEVSEKE